VDWDTTAKTASFTAVSGNGYFVNTTSGAITLTLPASPSAGDIVGFNDYARTFATNNLTVARNGSNIQGAAADGIFSTNGQSTMFVYVDGTQGWVPTEDQTTKLYGFSPVVATGGTITTCGDYKIHTFTGPGTFCVSCAGSCGAVDYLVIAGGGGGGGVAASNVGGGGGGAGGYRESSGAASGCYSVSPLGACVSALTITATAFPITVGGGGAGGVCSPGIPGCNGSNSIFSTITSTGGGFGAGGNAPAPTPNRFGGNPGGSGGGASYSPGVKGNGNTPPVSPPQGNNGGCASCSPYQGAAGGGGATAVGAENAGNGPPDNTYNGALGGAGATSSINATPTVRASGGSGGNYYPTSPSPSGATPGGGGAGGPGNGGPGCVGTANTGGGGGGAGSGNPGPGGAGGAGGSGIVIIRYKYQ